MRPQWGTVAGAWESGTRAAEAALRQMGAAEGAGEDKPARRAGKTVRAARRRSGEDD